MCALVSRGFLGCGGLDHEGCVLAPLVYLLLIPSAKIIDC